MPTLADGWSTIADGLHIHRWFLHVEPYRRERVSALRENHARRHGPRLSLTPTEAESVADTYGVGVAEHLFRQELTPDALVALRSSSPLPAVVRLAGRRVVSVRGEDLTGHSPAVLPAEVLRTRGPALAPEFAAEVTALLDHTQVAFVPQLVADVVVHGDVTEVPAGTVVLQPPATPDRYAEKLLVSAARQFATLFVVTRGMYLGGRTTPAPAPGGTWKSVEDGSEVGTTEMFAEIIAASMRFRFWERLAGAGHSAATTILPDQRERVSSYLPVVYDVAHAADDLNCYDLITTLCPGPRQFAKYRTGTGAGQGAD